MACGNVNVLFLVVLTVVILFVNLGKCEEATQEKSVEEGRTFGHHFLKRMSFAVIPLMYKMGMMTTLLITLTIMSTKGLAIGVLLLVLGISQIIARTYNVVPAPFAPQYAPAPIQYAAPAYPAPAPYPVVYSQVHKPDWPAVVPVAKAHHVVHAAPAYAQTYATGWHSKSGYSPYAREDAEEDPEYVKKN